MRADSRITASTLRILTLIDEYTRECLALRVGRRLNSLEAIDNLADVMLRMQVILASFA